MKQSPTGSAIKAADSVSFSGAGAGSVVSKAETAGEHYFCYRIGGSVDSSGASEVRVEDVVGATASTIFRLDVPASHHFELLFPGGLPTDRGKGMKVRLLAAPGQTRLSTLIQ